MPTRADEIRRRMSVVRNEIDDNVEELVEGAKSLVDWRDYVRSWPLASIGVACAVGFLAVPGRSRLADPDASALARTLKQNNLLVVSDEQEPSQKSWTSALASTLTSTLTSVAMRTAAAYLGQQMATRFSDSSSDVPTPSKQNQSSQPSDHRV